jgi:hypothetical protein
VYGQTWTGVAIITVVLLIALTSLATLKPFGKTVTANVVRLERRSFFRHDILEIPRRNWIELWVDDAGEKEVRYYLYTHAPDHPTLTYAIPLLAGSRQDTQEAARRITELLRLSWVPTLPAPGLPRFKEIVAQALAAYRRVNEEKKKAGFVKPVGRSMPTFLRFDCIQGPEAWLLAPERRTLTYQTHQGGRTDHSFDEVAEVEVKQDKEGTGPAAGEDSGYAYVYNVYLVLTSGERFNVRRTTSEEPKETEMSQARLDAEWTAGYLRKMIGMPEHG